MKKVFFLIICVLTYYSTSIAAFTKNDPISIFISAIVIYLALYLIYKTVFSLFFIALLLLANLAFIYFFSEYSQKIISIIDGFAI